MAQFSCSIGGATTDLKGTESYWAPELLLNENEVVKQSEATDVWAFGMTVFVRVSAIRCWN